MNYMVLNKEQSPQWNEYIERLPNHRQDFYSLPEYFEIFDELGHGKAECFVYEEDDSFLLYPYLRNDINSLNLIDLNKAFYDIQGIYGYNGPLTNNPKPEFLESFAKNFVLYCSSEDIIAEFRPPWW